MSDDIVTTEKKPITYSIYKINLNNKVYIGYTKREPLHRIKQHIYVANCVGKSHEIENLTRLKHAIRKYGAENLTYEVLAITTDHNEALEIEEKYIALYDSTNCEKGYNMLKNGAVYDPFARNRDFYKDEKYRKIRSEVVSGEKNGRYTGVTDVMIIDKAIEYFLIRRNIYATPWLKYCKTMGYPQNYDKKSKFRFNGEGTRGFYKAFLAECKKRSIPVFFNEMVCDIMRGRSFIELFNIYAEYATPFTPQDLPDKYKNKWEQVPSKKEKTAEQLEKN